MLRRRGEDAATIVVSVPVSGRASAGAELGNQAGVLPVILPAAGEPHEHMTRTARFTRDHKRGERGVSALSYARALNVSVIADPDVRPDHDALTAAVPEQLVMLTETSSVHND